MSKMTATAILTFFIALGVMLGGVLIGSLGALFLNQPPVNAMFELAKKLKIWALVTALGGTFPTIEVIETSFLGGQPTAIIKQTVLIMSSFFGAHLGYLIVISLAGGE